MYAIVVNRNERHAIEFYETMDKAISGVADLLQTIGVNANEWQITLGRAKNCKFMPNFEDGLAYWQVGKESKIGIDWLPVTADVMQDDTVWLPYCSLYNTPISKTNLVLHQALPPAYRQEGFLANLVLHSSANETDAQL